MKDKENIPALDDLSKENIELIEEQMDAEYERQLKKEDNKE